MKYPLYSAQEILPEFELYWSFNFATLNNFIYES